MEDPARQKPRALDGIRVLDLTRVLSGPICSRILSDQGAEVVKVEPPETDIFRSTPPHANGLATMYAQFNVGKRNVCVDLKAPGGVELIADLARHADVLVENFRPGVMQRMGLDAATLRERSPRLVYCSISGWGQEGPWAARAAYAPLVQAEAGTLALGGRLRRGPMRGEILQHADLYAGLMAANAILSALFYRERTGEGQHLDISMGETLLFVNEHAAAELSGFEGSRGFETWDFETFELGDGSFVHLLGSPVQIFPLLGAVLGIQEARADARFIDEASRFENRAFLVEILANRLREVPTPDALSALLEGTPAIAIPVRTTAELGATEWAAERDVVREVAPGLRVPVAPFRSDRVDVGIARAHVAHRGEDNRVVLKDWLDLSDERIERLTTGGALLESETEPASLVEAPRRAFRPGPNENEESSS